jgi:vitamin B12 transporter
MRIVMAWLVVAGIVWAQGTGGETPPPATEEKKEDAKPEEKKEAEPEEKEEMVVTAERMEVEKRLSGQSYGLIDGLDLEIRQDDELQEGVRALPGVHVAQTSTRGGLTSMFIRGGESDHGLVIVDGMEVNSDGGGIDLSNLTSDGVGRIELVRGAGSSVWGADSMSGTLHIITKRGEGPPRVFISSEYGNFSTARERVRFQAGDEQWGVTIALSRLDRQDGRWDHSDYENTTAVARFDYAIGEATRIKATVRYVDEEAEQFAIDPGPRFVVEDGDGLKREDDLVLGLEVAHDVCEYLTLTARLGRFDEDVRFDDLGSFQFDSVTDFERTKAGLQADAPWLKTEDFKAIFTLGVEWEREELTTSDSFSGGIGVRERRNNRAVYAEHRFEAWDRLGITLSGRADENNAFDTALTGRASITYDLKETGTRAHASIANGVKTPTMTEAFSTNPFFLGNRDLDPEKSRTMDVGIEQSLFDRKIVADLTFFENRMFDLIAFTGLNPAFENAGNARARGWEFTLEARPCDFLVLRGGWTYQRTRVTESDTQSIAFLQGHRLIRRPDNGGFAEIAVRCFYEDEVPKSQREEHPRFGVSLQAQYVGNRDDVLFFSFPDTTARIRNNDYLKVDLSAEWWVIDRTLRVFGVVENLPDTTYEEVAGYPNDPVSFLLGVELAFGVPKLKKAAK